MVKVGYRRYEESGAKKDNEGNAYNGWSNTYDEWVNAFSIRIQRADTVARIGRIACKKAVDEEDKEKNYVNDVSDVLINSVEGEETYAILRTDKVKSAPVVNMMNCFGKEGGFEKMIQRMTDKTRPVAYDYVYYYLDIVGTVWSMLHRKFAQHFIPRFQAAVLAFFESAPDLEIRKIQKDRFDRILVNLENLLQRVYTVVEKYRIMEHFELSMYTLFVKSNYLQLRIDGLKGINDFCKSVTKGRTRSVTEASLLKWIEKRKLVDEFFAHRKHQQLLQRSAPLLRFLYDRSAFTEKILENLWDLTKDEQLRQDLFRVLCEIGLPLHSPELAFFASKIVSMPPEEVTEEALDVIYEAYRNPNKTTEQLLKYADMIAGIAFGEGYPLSISEKALAKYAEMVSPLDYEPHKKELIAKTVKEMIGKNHHSLLGIKLLRKYLNQCVGASVAGLTTTRAAVIEWLVTEENLLKVLFDNFEWYYERAREQKNEIVIERYTHVENLHERIDFLGYLLTNCAPSYRMPIEYYYKMWKMMYEEPVSPDDSQVLFIFLKFIASDPASYARNFDIKEGKRFFEERIANPANSYENLSMKAFLCIHQFFNLINEMDGLLTSGPAAAARPQQRSFTSYSNTAGPSYETYSFTQKTDPPPVASGPAEVKTKVHPSKLTGIEVFWKIVQEARNTEVMEKSRDFLNKLYTQLSLDMQESADTVQSAFIETYLNKLAATMEDPMAFTKGTLNRMIKLMADMIDESERRGTGGIKSHSAITKGEILSFVVKNSLTSGKGIPTKMEIETYENTTIWELKAELGKYIESSPDCMKIAISSMEVKDTDHGKTVGEFVQKKSAVISIDRKNMDDVPKAPLLKEDQTLTERAKFAFAEIFAKFAQGDKMDPDGAATFIRNTTGEKNVTAKDPRIKQLFKNFDRDKDGFLTVADFQDFYRDCIINKKEETVRGNLQVHGFRNDLRKFNEVESVAIDVRSLPRQILSSNPKSFDLLFKALDFGGPAAEQVWDLVCRLTTNETIYRRVLTFDGAEHPDWPSIIDTRSTFRLLYVLQIINSFLEKTELADSKNGKWRQNFVAKGGFQYLLDVAMSRAKAGKPMGKYDKEALAVLIAVLAELIKEAVCSSTDKKVGKALKTVQTMYKKMGTIGEDQEGEMPPAEYKPAESAATQSPGSKPAEERADFRELFKAKPSTVVFPKGCHSERDRSPTKDYPETVLDESHSKMVITSLGEKETWKSAMSILEGIVLAETVPDHYDAKLAKAALGLFAASLFSNPALFGIVKSSTGFENLLLSGLIHSKSQPIREEFAFTVYSMCYVLKDFTESADPLGYCLGMLLKSIPENNPSSETAEFFYLTCKLIDLHYSSTSGLSSKVFSAEELLTRLVTAVKTYKPSEKATAESFLIGVVNTIRKVLDHEAGMKEKVSLTEGLLGELFFKCLFPPKQLSNTQKCKTKESRAAAYKLLATLCRASYASQSSLVKDCLEPLCQSIKPHNGWGYIPTAESRSKLGYVGIENLGCICYMNSMLQQFYMVPSFRYELLAADDGRPVAPEGDDNVLHQLRKMFAFLELSERQAYSPKQFCFAFKDVEGNPTNTTIQQDAQEFLNVVFDRMENLMVGTPQRYVVRSIFGGKTCSQLICKGGCGSVRNTFEDFYNLSVGVKGFKTLAESLNKFVSGDTISDYFCETCKKKVDVVKRTSLYELPNVLIIHLQRIIYNFDTFMNEKINSRLEFPKDFSIEPYTLEGMEGKEKPDVKAVGEKPNGYYHYKLAGVVVHIGTADTGHYYSYINTNRKRHCEDGEKDLFCSDKDLWLEFNDSRIRPFDVQKLESECFGGSSEQKELGWSIKTSEGSMKNAYMLVYEREMKTPIKKVLTKSEIENTKPETILACENTAQSRGQVGQVCFDAAKGEYYTFADFYNVRPVVPEGLSQIVQEDNATFLFERQIHSLEFFKFVNEIVGESYALLPELKGEGKVEIEKSLAGIGVKVVIDVLSHAYYNGHIKPLTKQLITLFNESTTALGEFLTFLKERFTTEVLNILHKCPDKDARVAVRDLVAGAVLAAAKAEEAAKTQPEADRYEEAKKLLFYATRVILLAVNHINNELAQHWARFDQYFETLLIIVKEGNETLRRYVNSKDLLKVLVDFYLGTESPFYEKKKDNRTHMGNKFRYPTFDPLVDLVVSLAGYADLGFIQPKDGVELREKCGLPGKVYELSEEGKTAVGTKKWIEKTIMERHSTAAFGRFVKFVCYESVKYSKIVAKAVLKGISQDLNQNMSTYFEVIRQVLSIEDSLQKIRMEWLLGVGTMLKGFTQLIAKEKPYEQLKFGLSLVTSIRDNVHEYPSPLAYKAPYDSLLNLLWNHRKSFDIAPISFILSMMVKIPAVFRYIVQLPPPTYQYAKYSDWIKPFVQAYRSAAKGSGLLAVLFNQRRDDTGYQEALGLVSELDNQLNKSLGPATETLPAFSQPYLVSKPTGENVLFTETKDGVTILATELVTDYYLSLPTGKDNSAVPQSFFEVQSTTIPGAATIPTASDLKPEEPKPAKVELKPAGTESMVFKLEARNSSPKTVKVRAAIVPKVGSTEMNFYCPASGLAYVVEPNRWVILYMTTKRTAGKPWGDFAVEWSTKTAVSTSKTEGYGKSEYEAGGEGPDSQYFTVEDIFPEEGIGAGSGRKCECCKGEVTGGPSTLCKKCTELFYGV